MDVRITANVAGSPDGIHVHDYKQDEVYELGSGLMPVSLAEVLVKELKVASYVVESALPAQDEKGPAGPSETKVEEPPAPESKVEALPPDAFVTDDGSPDSQPARGKK